MRNWRQNYHKRRRNSNPAAAGAIRPGRRASKRVTVAICWPARRHKPPTGSCRIPRRGNCDLLLACPSSRRRSRHSGESSHPGTSRKSGLCGDKVHRPNHLKRNATIRQCCYWILCTILYAAEHLVKGRECADWGGGCRDFGASGQYHFLEYVG